MLKEFRKDCINKNYPIMSDEGLDVILLHLKPHDHVLEIGTCVGYSSAYLATNLPLTIITIERDSERYQSAIKNLRNFESITPILGDALEVEVSGEFDAILFDAAKAQNIRFFNRYIDQLKADGTLFVDNVFFHGYVENPESIKNQKNLYRMVLKMKEFIDMIKSHPDFISEIIDVGDGLMVIKRNNTCL